MEQVLNHYYTACHIVYSVAWLADYSTEVNVVNIGGD